MPGELRSPKKGLINIKKNDQKCIFWCHIRHINPVEIHPERIGQTLKDLVNDLDYYRIEFAVRERDFSKIETKNNICINVYCYKNKLTFPIYISDLKFGNSVGLLQIFDGDKSFISKVLTDLCFTKQRMKTKSTVARAVYSVLVLKRY